MYLLRVLIVSLDYLCQSDFYDTQAPFTRVWTNFCTDEFCSWNACLHGSVQILLQIAVVFTRVRANFKTSRGIWMAFLRLCCDWLSLMFWTNHVAADAVRGKSNMTADKNFTWSDEKINLLLHVVMLQTTTQEIRGRSWLGNSREQRVMQKPS